MQLKVTLDLILNVPDDEKANQIEVIEELLNKLYVGAEHYEDDAFSVTDMQMISFEAV